MAVWGSRSGARRDVSGPARARGAPQAVALAWWWRRRQAPALPAGRSRPAAEAMGVCCSCSKRRSSSPMTRSRSAGTSPRMAVVTQVWRWSEEEGVDPADGPLDGLQLLDHVHAVGVLVHHLDHPPQVAVDALQAVEDVPALFDCGHGPLSRLSQPAYPTPPGEGSLLPLRVAQPSRDRLEGRGVRPRRGPGPGAASPGRRPARRGTGSGAPATAPAPPGARRPRRSRPPRRRGGPR